MVLTTVKGVLELTFVKVYGEIDDYKFTQNIFAKLYSCGLISEEICQKQYETKLEKNR